MKIIYRENIETRQLTTNLNTLISLASVQLDQKIEQILKMIKLEGKTSFISSPLWAWLTYRLLSGDNKFQVALNQDMISSVMLSH